MSGALKKAALKELQAHLEVERAKAADTVARQRLQAAEALTRSKYAEWVRANAELVEAIRDEVGSGT